MTSERVLEKTVSRDFIVNAIAEKLAQFSIIEDNEEVKNIQFETLFGIGGNGSIPIKVFLTKHQEVAN